MTKQRTYLKTHSWIRFKEDYRNLSFKTWIRLGEAQSKCDTISHVPLLPSVATDLHQIYLAKGILATTAIEGNTLTESEVQRRLRGELELPASKEYLGQEIDNVLEACNQIGQTVFVGRSTELCTQDIKDFNRIVLQGLPVAEDVIPGEIRTYSVGVGSYQGAPAEDCDYLLDRFCEWLNQDTTLPSVDMRVILGILKAILAHIYFAWIHPFGDGNGRTARLIEFQILLASGVPSAAAHLLSNHYNQTRSEYYRHLDKTSKSDSGIESFVEYAVQGFVDGLQEQLGLIRTQQLYVHWRDFVYESFRNKERNTDKRRRRLVLDLAGKAAPVPIPEIRHVSPRIAEAYANRTDKTVQRDLNVLEQMRLVRRSRAGIVANIDLMATFLSPTRVDDIDESA